METCISTMTAGPSTPDAWLILGIVAIGLVVALWLFARDDDSTKY